MCRSRGTVGIMVIERRRDSLHRNAPLGFEAAQVVVERRSEGFDNALGIRSFLVLVRLSEVVEEFADRVCGHTRKLEPLATRVNGRQSTSI